MIKLTSSYETFQEALYAPSFIPEKFYKIVGSAIQNISSSMVGVVHYDYVEAYVLDYFLREFGLKPGGEEARAAMAEDYERSVGRAVDFDIRECLSKMNVTYVSYIGSKDVLINSPQGRLI